MFERFTERARQVVVLAQDEARALSHNWIGTEHLLLGLLREESTAARVFEQLDVGLEETRAQVARIVGAGDEPPAGQIPFTPRAKKVLELSLREALTHGDNYIGPEHILLGLVRENEGVAARILLDFGADAETIRNVVLEWLASEPSKRPPRRRGRSRRGAEERGIELRPLEGRIDALGRDLAGLGRKMGFAYALTAVAFPAGLLVGWLLWG